MMLNGLDLFSGIGGLSVALAPWVKPVAYCERDEYAQAVLLSRMSEGSIATAPICSDITEFDGKRFAGRIDVCYGGFPCQDISVAGAGAGLAGERSGLFFEIMRLVDEIQPTFIFLENVPAIRTRGLGKVTSEITRRGYDSRWCMLSAAEVGAPHIRKRWWLLAYSKRELIRKQQGGQCGSQRKRAPELGDDGAKESMAHASSEGLQGLRSPKRVQKELAGSDGGSKVENAERKRLEESRYGGISQGPTDSATNASWWTTEPELGRVADGVPARVDRIKALGNAVVPLQAREAFKILMGLNNENEVSQDSDL